MEIYGAGMAGLLAGNMLRRHHPEVLEAQPALPDNHGALLRFRSSAVEEVTGIRFRKVRVQKGIKSDYGVVTTPSLDLTNKYSYKVSGEVTNRSVLDLSPGDRYIAPPTFLADLALGAGPRVRFGYPLTAEAISLRNAGSPPILSTIPMPALMAMVNWEPLPTFRWHPIWSLTFPITAPKVDVFQTLYYPDEDISLYRASITGDRMILEFIKDPAREYADPLDAIWGVMEDFGLPVGRGLVVGDHSISHQKYGKLAPMTPEDDAIRRRFIVAMSDQYNIYSLGRFATWRQLLLDDVVADVQKIERFILDRSGYARSLGR
jgi:hypothetical protein